MYKTSVSPEGSFRVGIHRPQYSVVNLRARQHLLDLGRDEQQNPVENTANFPTGDVDITSSRPVYEIRNAFPFRGCTYIDSGRADSRAKKPGSIRLQWPEKGSLLSLLLDHLDMESAGSIIKELPQHVKNELAQNSADQDELKLLAMGCCHLLFDEEGVPTGMRYCLNNGRFVPDIKDFELFETIANNPALPDKWKEVMALRPGVQGGSEIVGDYHTEETEIFEYLRGNSYIPWGHFAANFAHTSIKYRLADVSLADMKGLRHLFYQRSYVVAAEKAGVLGDVRLRAYRNDELEEMRKKIVISFAHQSPEKIATLWGWNFGYDYSGSGYRLHASHQMIHQQYAAVPETVATADGENYPAFSSGDMVADVVERYRQEYQSDFFTDFLANIRGNTRVDQGRGEPSLVVWEDEHCLLFVPKAQVSQWELQLMVTANTSTGAVGNIFEADTAVRTSLDTGIFLAQKVLAALGAKMVTSIEYSKRLGLDNGQRLLYSFLPKLPYAMGGFTEAHLRFICGHYPEDFATVCRQNLRDIVSVQR